jgi:hypothetical protein
MARLPSTVGRVLHVAALRTRPLESRRLALGLRSPTTLLRYTLGPPSRSRDSASGLRTRQGRTRPVSRLLRALEDESLRTCSLPPVVGRQHSPCVTDTRLCLKRHDARVVIPLTDEAGLQSNRVKTPARLQVGRADETHRVRKDDKDLPRGTRV